MAIAYSALAIVTVIATGNHYVLDIVGAAVVLAAGIAISTSISRRWSHHSARLDRRT